MRRGGPPVCLTSTARPVDRSNPTTSLQRSIVEPTGMSDVSLMPHYCPQTPLGSQRCRPDCCVGGRTGDLSSAGKNQSEGPGSRRSPSSDGLAGGHSKDDPEPAPVHLVHTEAGQGE